jgi:hypothetical protein
VERYDRRGPGSQLVQHLSDEQIGNIVFNETRSLSGAGIDEARVNIAHALINASASTHKFPLVASSTAEPGPGEDEIYQACSNAASTARGNVMAGIDPTDGAEHFNFRKNKSKANFQGHKIKTSIGPLNNSYPTKELPKSGIYANTYE